MYLCFIIYNFWSIPINCDSFRVLIIISLITIKQIKIIILNRKIFFIYFAVQPPSITKEEPVIIDDASDAKKVIEVTSLTVTTLFIGVFSLTYLLYFLSAKYFLF